MEIKPKIEIGEVSGAWIVTINEKSQAYSQHPMIKDHLRLLKDLLKALDIRNIVEFKER